MSFITRSLTQKLLIPLNKELHEKNSVLNNLFSSSSDAFSYSNRGNDSSREDKLLDDKIERIYIGFEKIGLPIHGFCDIFFFPTRILLPSELPIISGKRWVHASILVETKSYSICVEYGGYDGEDMTANPEKNYSTYYWFENSHGIRYAEMEYDDYKKYKLKYDSYSERIFTLRVGKNITLRQALRDCNKTRKWTYENYDLAKQNCQDFVAKFIDVTNAYRRKGEAHRGLHNISSTLIPKVILKEIEKNEDDGWNTVGKVPIIGPIVGIFHGIFS